MTPRETVIEAMADKIALIPSQLQAAMVICHLALDALLATLPALGLKIVPIEADEAMAEAWAGASIDTASAGLPDNEVNMLHAQSDWSAMLAAAPDLLGTGKQALKDSK